jgi:hypothetical protein
MLYFISAALYPGGSEVDRQAKGFSWQHNYWCDLLQPVAENGQPNKARAAAIIATAVLSVSIALFWYFVPRLFTFKSAIKTIIRYTGVFSMAILVLLQADFHDTILNIAGTSGIIAICGTLTGLYKRRSYGLCALGSICLFLFFVNNYVYYSKQYIGYLAVIQKISFVLFLLWFSLISIQLFQKIRHLSEGSR